MYPSFLDELAKGVGGIIAQFLWWAVQAGGKGGSTPLLQQPAPRKNGDGGCRGRWWSCGGVLFYRDAFSVFYEDWRGRNG